MSERRAVLISVGNDYSRCDVHMPIAPPLGILAVGSYLEQHDVPVELIDLQMDVGFGSTKAAERAICGRVTQYLAREIDAITWIGISMLSNAGIGLALGKAIRRALPKIPIVYGGYFPTRVERRLLEEHSFITAIVRGDGEAAALQISRLMASGRSFLCDAVPNLAWRDGGEIRSTPQMPMPIRALPNLNYRLLRNRRCYPVVFTMFSRGCPFSCTYCTESSMRPYVAYPIEWIRRQLDHLQKELASSHIGILDPIFGIGRKRALDTIELMRGRGLSYALESRVDVLDAELIPLLRQAGVDLIFWGVESGSTRTLRRMNKIPSVAKARGYLDDARAVLRACMENNIVPIVGLMFGFPGDSHADCKATVRLAAEISRIATEIADRTGTRPGFIPFATPTIVYDSTPLAKTLATKFPDVRLETGSFLGESAILSAGKNLSLGDSKRYASIVSVFGSFTPHALEQLDRFSTFVPKKFVARNPGLADPQGVAVISPDVRRLD